MTKPAPVESLLVTGGGGFLGQRLLRRLQGEARGLCAPGRDDLDLRDVGRVEEYMRQNRVETVVHLAACMDRREIPEAQEQQWRDTFDTGRALFLAASRAGVRRVIAAGSMDEVGVVDGLVGPDAPSQPITTYGLCKSLALETARFLAPRYGIQFEWFRPTAIYGPGQGDGPMLIPSAFVSGMSKAPKQFTSGEQKRDFVYVDDIVDWIVRALQLPFDDADASGAVCVHHLGSGTPIAVAEVLREIEKLTGGTFELGAIPRRPGEPDLFGVPPYVEDRAPLDAWHATTTLQEGLSNTWQWWKTA